MPSIKLVDHHREEEQVDLSKYLSVYYIENEVVNEKTGEIASTYHEAVECLSIPFIRDHEILKTFYADSPLEPLPFYCTDLDSFDIENDPWVTYKGKGFTMVVQYCDVAAVALQKDGSHCETDHAVIDAYLMNVDINPRITS